MPTIFLVAAAFGGAVLVLQLLLGVIGLGGGHDLGGHDGLVDGGLQLLTVRGVAAALTFFGIGGLAAQPLPADPLGSLLDAATWPLIGAAALLVLLGGLFLLFVKRYKRCPSNRLLASADG